MNLSKGRARAAIAVAAVAGVVAIAAVGCSTDESPIIPAQSTMPAQSEASSSASVPVASESRLETLGANQLSPTYWLGENAENVYLYREFSSVPDQGDPVVTSVKYMLEGTPKDPNYFNVWSPAERIGATITAENEITVDISSDAFDRSVDKGLAERSIQQLVYTATAAAANSGLLTGKQDPTVSIAVDGRTGYKAWGFVTLDKPMTRNSALRAPLWVIDPAEGSTYGEKLKVFGLTSRFTGGSFYEVLRVENGQTGDVVADGTISQANKLPTDSEFRLELDLEPGTYQLVVWGQNEGSSERVAVDTKSFAMS
ncbi:hypothetical protein HD598_000629 [Neomicrococcus aestuarii]|uniref:GerMN domain-containing protein n=1 Tax=Neomicrococcus aestuarii TaxID=556325 RepID=A0A7W8WZ64_9MICC|nr:GerMN domain-containing protein [Neomicrococcus aestuarii]MBB5511942.1 hypothetical protein [Neomicrococcus aestuarii]